MAGEHHHLHLVGRASIIILNLLQLGAPVLQPINITSQEEVGCLPRTETLSDYEKDC